MPSDVPMSRSQLSPAIIGPDPARVRDNQRRSRARRKEYLHELEAKLQECKRLGIQASVDIQTAARVVSMENARLKEENMRLSEENQKLTAMLRESGGDRRTSTTISIPESTTARRGYYVDPSKGEPYVAMKNAVRGPMGDGYSGIEPPMGLTKISGPTAPPTFNTYESFETEMPDPDDSLPPASDQLTVSSEQILRTSLPNPTAELVLGDDTSSCEYAAHIITSMRGDISTDDVRADLGCGNDVQEWPKCKVNNSKLFIAMDRYTG